MRILFLSRTFLAVFLMGCPTSSVDNSGDGGAYPYADAGNVDAGNVAHYPDAGATAADAGTSATQICTPSLASCVGDFRQVCLDDGRGFTEALQCDFGCENGECIEQACVPNERRCDGEIAYRCLDDGSADLATDCGALQKECIAGICTEPCQPACTGSDVCVDGVCHIEGLGEGTGEPCSSDVDCPDNGWPDTQFCSFESGSGECAIGCRSNTSCPQYHVCNGNRECIPEQVGPPGGINAPCEDTLFSSDCSSGLICTLLGCKEPCEPICEQTNSCCPLTDGICVGTLITYCS